MKFGRKSLLGVIVIAFVMAFIAPATSAFAAEGVVHSIFAEDGTRESARQIYGSQPTGNESDDILGEIVLEEGETISDSGFINQFKRDDAGFTDEYGTKIFSTSPGYWKDLDGNLHNIDDSTDPKHVGYYDYVYPYAESAVPMNYDMKTKQGGKKLFYNFTGVQSTNDGYITLYYHYHINGANAYGSRIATNGWVGWRIKVKPRTSTGTTKNAGAYLKYDTNGGTLGGKPYTLSAPFEDKNNTQYGDRNTSINVPIYGAEPQRDGYTFAFWQNLEAPLAKSVYLPSVATSDAPYSDVAAKNGYAVKNAYELSLNDSIRNDKTLTAIWDKNYDVKYYADDTKADLVDLDEGTFGLKFDGDKYAFISNTDDINTTIKPATSRDGYVFKGWKDEATGKLYQPSDAYAVTFNEPHRVLIAQWVKAQEKEKTVFRTEDGKTVREDDGDTRKNIPEGYTVIREEDPQVKTETVDGEEVKTTTYVVIVKADQPKQKDGNTNGGSSSKTTPSGSSSSTGSRTSANLAKTGSNVIALSGLALAVAIAAFVVLGIRRYHAE